MSTAAVESVALVQPEDFEHRGAFRLPQAVSRIESFEFGGRDMTFYPGGDPSGGDDGHPGSLFVVGHTHGDFLAEVTIPAPGRGGIESLPRAEYLQRFADVAGDDFSAYSEMIHSGIAFLDTPQTGPALHFCRGQHFEAQDAPTHAMIGLDLSSPGLQGPWHLDENHYATNQYIFEIPAQWADRYVGGRRLLTGRYRDGGWSGMGPAFFAYSPWGDDGQLARAGAVLEPVELVHYARPEQQGHLDDNVMRGYQHADDWPGGAWLTTPSGKAAVIMVGTRGTGQKNWYGFRHPTEPATPCLFEPAMDGGYPICWQSDGSVCPDEDFRGCSPQVSERGWWSSEHRAHVLLYDPADLAQVATGSMDPEEPQPYGHLDITDHLYLPGGGYEWLLGARPQRRQQVGGVAYDRASSILYIAEFHADGAAPVVHVLAIR